MKFQPSGIAAVDMRGSAGGSCASKNAYANFFRNVVSPINRGTPAQSAIRITFAFFSSRWSATLTESQRQAWIAFSSQHQFSFTFGLKRSLQGKEMFVKINQALANAAMTTIDDPPTDLETGDLGALTLVATVAAGGTLTVATVESNVGAGAKLNIWATEVVSNGRNSVSNKIRYLDTVALGGSPYDIKAAWIAKYGAFPTVANGKIVVLLQIISSEGWLGQSVTAAQLLS